MTSSRRFKEVQVAVSLVLGGAVAGVVAVLVTLFLPPLGGVLIALVCALAGKRLERGEPGVGGESA